MPSLLIALAIGLVTPALAQDPELRHDLDELASRQGDKPWVRLYSDGHFPSERTIFRDTLTGAEIWRLTDDTREDRHDYYDVPVWNSTGTSMVLSRKNEVVPGRWWLLSADGSMTRPVASFSEENLFDPEAKVETSEGCNCWSWVDPTRIYSMANGVVSLIEPIEFEETVLFDVMTEPINDNPELPVLEKEDFTLQNPHPLDDRLLMSTGNKGRIFTLDLLTLELAEIPTDGRWELPADVEEDQVGIHRLRWTKERDQFRVFIGQDHRMEDGEVIFDPVQYIATMDGELTAYNLDGEDSRGGHPAMAIDGSAITGDYHGAIWKQGVDGASPDRKLYYAKTTQHHGGPTWDLEWVATDNSVYYSGGELELRGFDVERSIVLMSLDGRSQNVLNYHYASYAVDESTHPGPTSSPDGTKIAYDSDMLDRAVGGGGDGDGNPDLWMVVVRPPRQPRNVSTRPFSTRVQLSWERPYHSREEIYWNPGNEAREILGYNVFRADASGGPYDQLNDNLVRVNTYDDLSVEPGVNYYYVVQSVESSGLASVYSPEVFAATTSRRWQGDVLHFYEAEYAELTLPMVQQFAPGATNGDWFAGTFAQEPDPAFPLEPGPAAVTFEVSAPMAAHYSLWAKVRGFEFGGTFDVEVDGVVQSEQLVVEPGEWGWVALPGTVRLRRGDRSVKLSTLDTAIGIDMLAIGLGSEVEPPTFGNRDATAPAPPSDARVVSLDGNTKQIVWSPSPDKDVRHYNVYCGRDSSYPLGNANILRSPVGTEAIDWGIPGGIATVYKITAVDRYGNESEPIVFDSGVEGDESAPEALDDSYSIDEDDLLDVPALGVLANDLDADGDPLTAALVSGVENGTLELFSDGGFTYTPNLEFAGEDTFSYRASDGVSTSDIAAVTITVGVVDDPPVALDDAYVLDEDVNFASGVASGVLANDTDAERSPLEAALVSGALHGEVTLMTNGAVHYTPDDDYVGADSFTYTASDGVNDSNVATVSLTVLAIEDLPDAETDEYAIDEDTVLDIPAPGVLANDGDADGDALQALLVDSPTNGDLVLRPDGGFTYTPHANYYGFETFTYVATDGKGSSAVEDVRIVISAVNDVPAASADAYSTDEDTTLEIDPSGVLANDSDADGQNLKANLVSDVEHGTLNLRTSGSILYIPDRDFNGVDRFTYVASDDVSDSNEVTVTLTIGAMNDGPVAKSDDYVVAEDSVLDVAAPGVLANDYDDDGESLTALLVTDPLEGTVTLNPDGSFVYTPPVDFEGLDSFTYQASDGTAESTVVSVRIVVTAINDLPLAADDALTIEEDGFLEVETPGVLANDTDVDGDNLEAILAADTQHGLLTLKSNGKVIYRPDDDFVGIDTFTYWASDGTATSNLATVTITVTNVNDPPTAVSDLFEVDEDIVLDVPAPGVLVNDSDIDAGATLTAELVVGALNGTVDLQPDGRLVYTPNPEFEGVEFLTYRITDGELFSTEAQIRIDVRKVNDPPVAVADDLATPFETPLEFPAPGVLTNDSDVDDTNLTAVLVTDVQTGTLLLQGSGLTRYIPESGFTGTVSFTYQASDGEDVSAPVTVTISVQ